MNKKKEIDVLLVQSNEELGIGLAYHLAREVAEIKTPCLHVISDPINKKIGMGDLKFKEKSYDSIIKSISVNKKEKKEKQKRGNKFTNKKKKRKNK